MLLPVALVLQSRPDLLVAVLLPAIVAVLLTVRSLIPETPAETVLVIGNGSRAAALAAAVDASEFQQGGALTARSREMKSDVVQATSLAAAADILPHIHCNRVVLVDQPDSGISIPMDARGVHPKIVATDAELHRVLGRVPLESMGHQPLVRSRHLDSLSYRFIKRTLDLCVAIPLGLVLLFAMPLLWLAIRLDSPGPLLYSQTRVGLGGRLFRIYKFRSMRHNAEANGPVWAAANDSRVTRFGRFLRSTRIDELPQVWNIVRGEMSLVGPRPERPEFTEIIEREYPAFRLRTQVKPGVTGWAQVRAGYGRSVSDARTKLEYDLFYVAYGSIRLDAKTLVSTVPVVIGRKGS